MPITPIINKNQNINIETNIPEKLKECFKIDIFDTFHESFLELKYSFSSKLENVSEQNGKQRSLETKIQLLENRIKNLRNLKAT